MSIGWRGTRRRSTLAFLTSSSLAQAGSFAVGGIITSSILGPHGRGLMVLGTSIASITPLLTGLGTGPELRARLPRLSDPAARRRTIASYTFWSALATVGASLIAIGLSTVSAHHIDSAMAEPTYLFAVAVVTVGYGGLIQFPDLWYAAGRFRSGSAWAAAAAAGGVIAMVAAASIERTVWVLLLAQGSGMLIVAIAQGHRLHRVGLLVVAVPARQELFQLLNGWRALGLTSGLSLISRIDRYILGAVAGAAAVGVYSLATTLSEATRICPNAIGQIVNREVAIGNRPDLIRRSWRLAMTVAAGAAACIAVAGWTLITPVFGQAFAGARPLLILLLLAEIAFAPFSIASNGLLGGGWMSTAGTLGIAGAMFAGVLYAVAVPVWGAYGAAGASLIIYCGMSVTAWVLFRHRLAEQHPLPVPPAYATSR